MANGAITGWLRAARGLSTRVTAGLRASLDYSARLRALEAGFRGYAWAPAAAVLAYAILHAPAFAGRTGFAREEFPVAMAGRVDKLPGDSRLLAPDKYGGYLIYRFSGARKVFFDGRSDFYGAEGDDLVEGLEDVSRFPYLVAELLQRGWSDEDVAKLTRGNLVRVLSEAEQAAIRLQQERPPSLLTFEAQPAD